MAALTLKLDYRLAPEADGDTARTLGAILCRPCFAALSRVAVQVKDREKNHRPKTPSAVAEALLAPESDAAALDSGRQGDLVASAVIRTRRRTRKWDDPTQPIDSFVIVPYEPSQREALIAAFLDLAEALQAVGGFVAVEPDFERAHRAAYDEPWRLQDYPGYPKRRAQERKGRSRYAKRLATEVAGPEWALLFGPGHLRRFTPELGPVFVVVREAGAAKLGQLTEEPADALAPGFEEKLEAARRALSPILMDVSSIPVNYGVM